MIRLALIFTLYWFSNQSFAIEYDFRSRTINTINRTHVWYATQLPDLSITYRSNILDNTICLPTYRAVVVKLPSPLNKNNPYLALFIKSFLGLQLPTIQLNPTIKQHLDTSLTTSTVYCFNSTLQHMRSWVQLHHTPQLQDGLSITYCNLYPPSDPRNYQPEACPTLLPLPVIGTLDQVCGDGIPKFRECVVMKDIDAKLDIFTTESSSSSFASATKYFSSEHKLLFPATNSEFTATHRFGCSARRLTNCIDIYSEGNKQINNARSAIGKAAWLAVWKMHNDVTVASFNRWWAQKAGQMVTYQAWLTSYPGWLRSQQRIGQLHKPSLTLYNQTPSCTAHPEVTTCVHLNVIRNR